MLQQVRRCFDHVSEKR